MPPHDVVATLMDKIEFFKFATTHGFLVPRGAVVHSREDALSAAEALRFPCVVKPAIKTAAWQARSKAKVYKVRDRNELLTAVDCCTAWTDSLLVQEWIEGGDENCYTCNCYLTADGKAVASFVSRKVRQWPPQTGIGCLSVEARNELVRQETIRLFEVIGFHGLGYVEFKVDQRTGEHFIVEPNVARPTGRSAMAEAGGVELLYTMYRDALGDALPNDLQQTYRGVKWIHLRQDMRAAWAHWRSGELSVRAWWDTVKGPKTYAIFSWSDPAPFCGDLLKVMRRATKRLRRVRHEGLAGAP
jgi:predicted ATP-grasp superfamily ATP-dependent carboligase